MWRQCWSKITIAGSACCSCSPARLMRRPRRRFVDIPAAVPQRPARSRAQPGVRELHDWGRTMVICPGFVADCLETIDEIGHVGLEQFRAAGGETLQRVAGLNDRPPWIAAIRRDRARAAPGLAVSVTGIAYTAADVAPACLKHQAAWPRCSISESVSGDACTSCSSG